MSSTIILSGLLLHPHEKINRAVRAKNFRRSRQLSRRDLRRPLRRNLHAYDLRQAHHSNDKAVAQAYGFENILNDESAVIVAMLKLYKKFC